MTVFLALVALLVPASVTFVGLLFARQSAKRLAQEDSQSKKRLEQQHDEEEARLRLDAAMRAASLFGPVDGSPPSPAASAAGLLALTQLGHADLAVALLVDLWDIQARPSAVGADERVSTGVPGSTPRLGRGRADSVSTDVSTENAILVINEALLSIASPSAQLVAAELLCRNASRLDPCQSLHWPAALDGRWIPSLGTRAKLLIMDALTLMTLGSRPTENALRALAVRLYGAWSGDPENARVRGCVGQLISSILPALRGLSYADFMQAQEVVTLAELEVAAASASPNPDGYLERLVNDRSEKLQEWSSNCDTCDLRPGILASAAHQL